MVNTDSTKISQLLTRGVENVYPNRDFLAKLLASGKRLTLYTGYDPTASTLHIGHAITLLKLREFQDLGHKIIMLIGDFTGMIGDPTDKGATRQQLTRAQVMANCKEYKKQASAILDFGGKNPAELKYNSKWLAKLSFADVLELASHFSVQRMLERDMFQDRMEQDRPIYIHEFLYPVMQAYDSVFMDVDGEIGGNDQTFNMLAGRDLMKSLKNKEKFVLTTKLLTDSGGRKMGKSEGNMVALSASAQDMFGGIMSWSDELIINGFVLCTRLTEEEIKRMEQDLKSGVNPRDLKAKLAFEITKIYYGEVAAQKAQQEFDKVFRQKGLPEDIRKVKLAGTYKLVDLVAATGLASSKSEARRLIDQKAIKIDGKVKTNWQEEIEVARGMTGQAGPRNFIKFD
jgi:tyrosyl-tRNA synthetase